MLEQLPASELFALDEQVKAVTKLPGWERICAYIGAGRENVLRSLTIGPTRDHAEQSRVIGYIAGLEEAPNVVQAIAEAASRKRAQLESAAVADQTARQEERTP